MPLFEFEYDPTFEDHLLFNKVAKHQKRKLINALRIIIGLIAVIYLFAALGSLLNIGTDDFSYPSFVSDNFLMIICAVFAIALNQISMSLVKQSLKSTLETHKQFCAHTNVKIYDNYITEYCRYASANYSYEIFTELVVTPQLMALYCAPNNAIFFPRRLFYDNAWNWLYGFLTDKFTKNGAKITIINKVFK